MKSWLPVFPLSNLPVTEDNTNAYTSSSAQRVKWPHVNITGLEQIEAPSAPETEEWQLECVGEWAI